MPVSVVGELHDVSIAHCQSMAPSQEGTLPLASPRQMQFGTDPSSMLQPSTTPSLSTPAMQELDRNDGERRCRCAERQKRSSLRHRCCPPSAKQRLQPRGSPAPSLSRLEAGTPPRLRCCREAPVSRDSRSPQDARAPPTRPQPISRSVHDAASRDGSLYGAGRWPTSLVPPLRHVTRHFSKQPQEGVLQGVVPRAAEEHGYLCLDR